MQVRLGPSGYESVVVGSMAGDGAVHYTPIKPPFSIYYYYSPPQYRILTTYMDARVSVLD